MGQTSPMDIATKVTRALLRYLETEREALDSEAHPLLNEIEALISAGGKRLRPLFCYWGHRAAGGKESPEIIRAGAALELLHTFALIHDDVMDRSSSRRSRATTFRALAELAAGVPHRGDPVRFGTSAAILTGLLGFVLADRLFYSAGFPLEATMRASDRYDRMRLHAIGGQYLDLLAAHRGEADEDVARRIGALKSGGYSVADPLVIGALLATDDASVISTLDGYGRPLGEAFQMRDDVLGVFGDPTQTGKDGDGDLREGKQTVLLAKTRALATASGRVEIDRWVGDPELSKENADRVREVMRASGALDRTNELIADLAEQAAKALANGNLDPDAEVQLRDLAERATMRNR
jgi:geranylgeranyl diphosphate synthase, type I